MKMKYIFSLLLVININLIADITKPFEINVKEQYDAGLLLYDEFYNNQINNKTFYFIKKNFVNDNETIYKWKGIHRNNTKAEALNNTNIVDAICFQNKLILILQENSNTFIADFDDKINRKTLITNKVNANMKCIYNYKNEKLFMLLDDCLYEIIMTDDNVQINSIAENILAAKVLNGRDDYMLSYIVDRNDVGLLYVLVRQQVQLESSYKHEYIGRIPITNNTDLFAIGNELIITNSISENSAVYVSSVSLVSNTIVENHWINTNQNLLCFSDVENKLFAITEEYTDYYINIIPSNSLANVDTWSSAKLPSNLYKPLKLLSSNDKLFVFFTNNLLIYDMNLLEVGLSSFDYSMFNDKDFVVDLIGDNVIITSSNNNIIYELSANNLWWFYKYLFLSYRFAVPLLLLLLSFIIYRKYRNQKRMLDLIIDLPGSGFLFIVDRVGRLIKINYGGKVLLGLSDNIPMRKDFIYYCNSESSRHINDLIELGLKNKYPFQQKINIIEDNMSVEWLCSLFPLNNITGMFKGVVLTGIDITDALEKQLLTSWAQLAHDMQTNLSTIRLNAEQLELNNEEDINRKNKMLHQVSILVHRIRDIVTVGRDDKLNLQSVNSTDLCNEIKNEFDANIFSNVSFKMELNDFNFLCDKSKLSRALRNAVENGIKYMKNKGGIITISCSKDIHNITLSVKDTGIGMDDITKKKIFTPFYSTTRQLGGHGIGTMIMQRVVEQHGGKLIIESQLGIGTEIIFSLPDLSRKRK